MCAPPSGPPWDLPVSKAPLAFVDLEMTGLNVAVDRVIEVCIERVADGRPQGSLHTLINPGQHVGQTAIHGLDAGSLVEAPPFAAVADRVGELLDGAAPIAHAARWDARFLAAEAARAACRIDPGFWIDTLALSRRAFAFPSYALGSLCRELGIDPGIAHRADSDVRSLRAVFERCVAILRPQSVRDLWQVRVGQRRARPAIVQACRDAARAGVPVTMTYRPAGRPAQALSMLVVDVRADLDPPLIVGYQLPERGRRQLRADRILHVDPVAAVNSP